MDKSWINNKSRASDSYLKGVANFLEFAFANGDRNGTIRCPCMKCNNCVWKSREDVRDDIVCNGFVMNYTRWVNHGEPSLSSMHANTNASHTEPDLYPCDDMDGLLHDAVEVPYHNDETMYDRREGTNAEAENFYKLVNDADQELYPGCKKFNKLSFIVRLYHIKCLSGWSNKSFDMLLDLLKEALPEGETLPKSFYETKRTIGELGLNYEKIHACTNDCMLFWKESSGASSCSACGASRWKDDERKIPMKILQYFPLKPRLQRLFMSEKTASSMRWHDEKRTKDGILRHPADSPAWKTFDYKNNYFSSDSRNVRLGLANDGFNPFRTMNIVHSMWPVVMMTYNLPPWMYLPPWMCMQQPYMMLTLLIPGPKAPGNDIDVYLQPLIDELKEL